MYIYDQVSNFISGLVARRQLYRCVVDGRGEFMGETLPVGTQERILAWIKARYKVLGEIFVVGSEDLGPRFIFSLRSPMFSDETFFPCQQTVRYLVEVEGVERMFVLRPVPDALLEWHPGRALT